ncbi:MAG: acyl-CoA dehydrogenase family protein [Clostridium sp.]
MSKLTKEEFQAYLKQIRELAEGPLEEIQKEVEVTNKFPQEFYDLAIENNLYRCSLPEEYGGWGLNELEILQVQEEFSRGPGGMRMHLHYAMDLNWRILDDYGSPELKAEYMSKFQNKEVFTCFALTEATGGTGADLHTMAVKDGDSYVLNGEKTLISHTDCCEFAYVIAVTNPDSDKDDRLSAFFVPMDAPGFEVINMPHMMGCRGAGHGDLKFTNCRIDKKYLLGREGQGLEIAMHSLSVSRAHIAASNLGMAQRMLELSLAYAHDRVTFGKPIGTRQAIRVKIADMSMMVHALRCMVYDFAKAYDGEPDRRVALRRRLLCVSSSVLIPPEKSAMRCLRSPGGVGYFEDCKYGPVRETVPATAAQCGWKRALRPFKRITISRNTIKHGAHMEYVL